MADSAPEDLTRNILRNIIPLDTPGMNNMAQGANDMVMKLLQTLGLAQASQPAAPPLNAPLPRMNPQTGQVEFPAGYQGPR
jgi:hypothetical protein